MMTERTYRMQWIGSLCLILIYIYDFQDNHGADAQTSACATYRSPIDGNADAAPINYTNGSIVYTCVPGFYVEGLKITNVTYNVTCLKKSTIWSEGNCIDIDECSNTHGCDTDADCINTVGSYICICRKGYTGTGESSNCTRVTCNELKDIPYATTTATLANEVDYEDVVQYTCSPGYVVNNVQGLNADTMALYEYTDTTFKVTCKADGCWSTWPLPYCVSAASTLVMCGDPGVHVNATRSAGDFTINSDIIYTCNEGYRLTPKVNDPQTFTITCGSDGSWDSLQQCIDLNECQESTDSCHRASNSECINIPGSHICRCRDGYTGDGRTCARIACDVLSPILNSESTPLALLEPKFEDQVTVQCDPGYQVWLSDVPSYLGFYSYTAVTTFTLTCTSVGLWKPWPPPICHQITCHTLPPLPNAYAVSVVPSAPVYKDEVFYTCDKGYQVLHQTPYTSYLPIFSGDIHQSSFRITCSATGQWDPLPLPVCVPVYCGDPGLLFHAARSGSNLFYGHEVQYKCLGGFLAEDISLGHTGFTQTCQVDGTWSRATVCVDIDECTEYPDICGKGVNYCMNTPGSYMCSCVPWYINNLDDNRCLEWAGLDNFDSSKPCDIVQSLNLCINGDCKLQDGQAICRCWDGYQGVACDVKMFTTGLIISIIAMVLTVLLIISLCVSSLSQSFRQPILNPAQFPPRPPAPYMPAATLKDQLGVRRSFNNRAWRQF